MSRWSEFVEHTSLKQTWDLLRPDLRGHGESFPRGRLSLTLIASRVCRSQQPERAGKKRPGRA
jgi:pimeloyl-ACP methyl ester carboxylesterase